MGAASPQSTNTTPPNPTGGADPFAQYVTGGAAEKPQSTPEPQNTDPFAKYQVGGGAPASGSDPDAPFYKKAWEWANKPLVDVDDALGRTGQAGGVENGANDLVSGLTSPLSIALTVGTLGAGGLIESGAASVLREAGLLEGADALSDVTKGAKIVANEAKNGRTFEEGLAAAKTAGVDTERLTKSLSALKDAKLDASSLTSAKDLRRISAAGLRNLGVGAGKADKAGAIMQSLVSAGFTYQGLSQAAEQSPKFLDALKDGDYDTAQRLAVDILGGGGMALLGAHQLTKEAGGIRDAAAKLGLSVKPSAENLLLKKNFGQYDEDIVREGKANEIWAQDLRKKYPDMSPEQLERVKYYVEAGQDEDLMARRHDVLAEIAGSDQRAVDTGKSPENGDPITTGMTPERVKELTVNKKMLERYSPEELENLRNAYDPRKLTDKDKALAAEITAKHNETLEAAQKRGVLGEGVQHYSTNLWGQDDADNEAANTLNHDARNGTFDVNTSQARARMFDSAFEGQLLGKKLVETDPIALAAHNANTFARVIAGRDAMDRLQDTGVAASDGRPMVALAGNAQTDGETGNVLVNPASMRNIKIADQVVDGLKQSGDLDRMLKEGKIVNLTQKITPENIQQNIDRLQERSISAPIKFDEQGRSIYNQQVSLLKAIRDGKIPVSKLDDINAQRPAVYAWNPSDYKTVDSPAMRGIKHVAQTPDGTSVMLKSDLLAHPEAHEYLERILGVDKQGIGDSTIGKGLLKANREGKGLLLFGSPFHIMQEGLRAVMTGVNPFGIEKWDLRNDPVLSRGVRNGLTVGKDYRNIAAYQDGQEAGHSALLEKIPGAKQVQSGLDHFLFDKYVPGLKVRGYRRLVEKYAKKYPDWTPDKVAQTAAADTNERFGGINYKQLGRSAATQNWMKLVSLAPDWLESEVRAMARPFGSEGKVARADMLKATVGLWGAARIMNYLTTGSFHNEAPFGVAVKGDDGKEKVYSIRTLPTDALHAVSDPVGFVRGRMSPLVKAGDELATGRDDQGKRLPNAGLAVDLMRAVAPIPAQSIIKAATGEIPDTTSGEQAAKAAGLTVLPYKTEAQKLAAQIASDHSETGPVDPAMLQRHQLLMKFEDDLRAGKTTLPEIHELAINGSLPPEDVKKIAQNYAKTKDMNGDLASLYTRASRLPAKDLLDVFDAGTPSEKTALLPLVKTARRKYVANAMKTMQPSERVKDPVLQRFVKMYPGEPLF